MRTVVRKPCNHALHLFLTLITLGVWSPVWVVVAIVGKRETVTTYPQHNAHQVTPGYDYNPYNGQWVPR